MVDELLPHYNRELTYIRRLAAEFAEAHPKVAGRLRLSADAVEDPHVARLIESFAFLTARVRQKLDDEFPELTDGLLGVLYPHYIAPVPSMAIAQFQCAPDLAGPVEVPRGLMLDTEPVAGEPCRYRTCYPTTVWPIVLEAAALTGRPIVAPPNPKAPGAVASLRLTLRCAMPEMTFTQLGVDRLRFFLRGQPQQVFPLYELLFNNAVSIALADGPNDPNPVILPPGAIEPVGFGAEEGMLPYPARSFVGYRLLTEYFAFPEKFLFFDLAGLSAKGLVEAGNKLEVFVYFNRTVSDLERSLGEENFALGCTAVANLFRQRAEPIQLSHRLHEYRVVPDARRPGATEVYSVERVVATSSQGETIEYRPFYSVRHGGDQESRVFWHAARRRAGERDPGTELFISLVDLDFDPRIPADWTLSVETTCLNRDLPSRLPYGGGRPTLEAVEGAPGITKIACVTPPTPTLRPDFGAGGRWRLVSHLTLNHLSLVDSGDGAEALREILRLYDFRDSSETRAVIDSVLAISFRRGVARAPAREMGAFCRGIDVTVEFDDQRFSGSGLFLLACVLERFLGLYCSVNSFSRLTAKVKGRTGVLRTWPPRAGDRILL